MPPSGLTRLPETSRPVEARALETLMRISLLVCLIWIVATLEGATSVRGLSQNDDPYVGNQMCIRCHEDVQKALVEVPHGGGNAPEVVDDGCQSCHGPGRAHVQRPNDADRHPSIVRLSVDEQGQLCASCHGDLPSFDATHGRELTSCASCHT
ncbi:MAG: hypothetical protein ACRD1X_10895, partial [Vicinamibacteria bacterium]